MTILSARTLAHVKRGILDLLLPDIVSSTVFTTHGIRCDRHTRLLQHVTSILLPFSIEFGILTYFASSVFLTGNICCFMRRILK